MRNLVALSFLAVLVLIVVSCSVEFKSNGERIYYTSTSESGKPIYSLGFTMMHGRIACVNCHGRDGHGGEVFMMMYRFEAPDITWAELTGPHEDHAPYTEETIKDAITKGFEPNGEQLDSPMPIWNMASEDLDDLVGFLKTLN